MGGMRGRSPGYRVTAVETSAADVRVGFSRARARAALRHRGNWEQLVKFCFVGATGYIVNLWVFGLLVLVARAPLHPGRRLLVPRRRHQQLRVEPPVDVP